MLKESFMKYLIIEKKSMQAKIKGMIISPFLFLPNYFNPVTFQKPDCDICVIYYTGGRKD